MVECDKKVLIVDDDSSVLQLYRQLLGIRDGQSDESSVLSELMSLVDESVPSSRQSEQCDVILVDQGEKAVKEVHAALQQEDPFQLLFLDMRLPPGMDGKATALQVRELQPELPIVFVTAFSDHAEQDLVEALPTAPIYFNYKPFARTELESAIQELALSS